MGDTTSFSGTGLPTAMVEALSLYTEVEVDYTLNDIRADTTDKPVDQTVTGWISKVDRVAMRHYEESEQDYSRLRLTPDEIDDPYDAIQLDLWNRDSDTGVQVRGIGHRDDGTEFMRPLGTVAEIRVTGERRPGDLN